mmetsp:Transcript_15981/g.24788  ORF Transcript_15981/g.24788 Transcript_15981/m.24788 type:complete len:91 (+) Transcript_15981:292-564(+)
MILTALEKEFEVFSSIEKEVGPYLQQAVEAIGIEDMQAPKQATPLSTYDAELWSEYLGYSKEFLIGFVEGSLGTDASSTTDSTTSALSTS